MAQKDGQWTFDDHHIGLKKGSVLGERIAIRPAGMRVSNWYSFARMICNRANQDIAKHDAVMQFVTTEVRGIKERLKKLVEE